MIYGYPEKVVNEEYGLLQMREISFAMSAAQLRLVATFLVRVAEELESGGPSSTGISRKLCPIGGQRSRVRIS